jgi:hypothetical protein
MHKPINKLVLMKVIFGVYLSLHLLPMAKMALLFMYNIVHRTMICTDCLTNCAISCGGILLKMLQNIVIKLQHANWRLRPEKCLFTANVRVSHRCLMVDRGRHMIIWTYTVWKMLMLNPLCFPASALCCTLCQVNVGEFSPGEALHVNVDLISEVLISSFKTSMPQEVWESVDMWTAHTSVFAASLSAVYRGWCPHIWTSSVNGYEIQLFFFLSPPEYFNGFAWFPALVRPKLTVHSTERTHL